MPSSLLASAEVIEFRITEAYSNLGLTTVKYNVSIQSREDKGKATLRTRPSNLVINITMKESSKLISNPRSFTKKVRRIAYCIH